MRTLLLTLLLAACGPKRPPPAAAANPTPAAVAGVVDRADERAVDPLPKELVARLDAVLQERNLPPHAIADAAVTQAFAGRRTTPQRLAWLAERADGAPLLLLVETEVAFYSQLEGRYRWTVEVHLTIASTSDPGASVTRSFEVPVFLQFHHEREPEALDAAAPVIERRLASLVDAWLGGLGE